MKSSKSVDENVMRNVGRLIGRGVDALNDEPAAQKQDYPAIALYAQEVAKRSPDKR